MKTIKARAVVITEYDVGEADKRLVLLSKTHGLLYVFARGARRPKSKFIASASLFAYSDFLLAAGQGFLSLLQADLIEGFFSLRQDYERLRVAHMLAEACVTTIFQANPCDAALLLLLKAQSRLSRGISPNIVQAVFFMKFFQFHGLTPEIHVCTTCKQPLAGIERVMFGSNGIMCANHARTQAVRFSAESAETLGLILTCDVSAAFSVSLSDRNIRQILGAAKLMWAAHFEKPLVSGGL